MILSLSAARAVRVPTSPLNVVVAGREAASVRGLTEIAFTRADAEPPAALGDATVEAVPDARAWRVTSTAAGAFMITAESAFVHRDVSLEFAAIVPPPRAPWAMRLAWGLMPTIVALPFGRRILAAVAGSR